MEQILHHIKSNPYFFALVVVLVSFLAAHIVEFITARVLLRLASKTKTELDDEFIINIRKPLFYTVLLIGIHLALRRLPIPTEVIQVTGRLLISIGVLLWTGAVMKTGKSVLKALAKRIDAESRVIQQRTLPLFEITLKTVVIGGAAYGVLLTWNVDVTAWLASAGIVGIAIGFASKDTLANLFSGIFILADAPYKLGDYIVLDSGERGMVTDIGIRSTRILTRDDIQIIIPNAAIGSVKIVNETGGRNSKRRIRIKVGVAYGSDVDLVRNVLVNVADRNNQVSKEPEPRVRFRRFGDSALEFELLCWVDEPELKGRVQDSVNMEVYKAFINENILIPFPQRDLYIKEWPSKP